MEDKERWAIVPKGRVDRRSGRENPITRQQREKENRRNTTGGVERKEAASCHPLQMAAITQTGEGEVVGEDGERTTDEPRGIVTMVSVLLFKKEGDIGGL